MTEINEWIEFKDQLIATRDFILKTYFTRPPKQFRLEEALCKSLDGIDMALEESDIYILSKKDFAAKYEYCGGGSSDTGPEDLRDDWPHAMSVLREAAEY